MGTIQTISNTTTYPYTAVVYIVATFPDGQAIQGSGVMVGINEVLTASHMVYQTSLGGAAVKVQVAPAYNSANAVPAPYGSFFGVYEHYASLNNANDQISLSQVQDDVALVALSTPLGEKTGWLGVDPNFTSGAVSIVGYPAAYGGQLTASPGTTSLTFTSQNTPYLDTSAFVVSPGNSGGPLIEAANGGYYVVGVVSTATAASPTTVANPHYTTYSSDVIADHQFVSAFLPIINANNQAFIAGSSLADTIQYSVGQSFAVPVSDSFLVSTVSNTALSSTDFDPVSRSVVTVVANSSSTQLSIALHPNWSNHPGATQLDFYLVLSDPGAGQFNDGYVSHQVDITITKGTGGLSQSGSVVTYTYQGASSHFTIQSAANGFVVTDTSGIEGSMTLASVERLHFPDINIALDINGVAGSTYRLYQAAFDRTPDLTGLGYWIAQEDNGLSPITAAADFIGSAEFTTLYGVTPTVSQLVGGFYENVLHRTPDPAGFNFYVNAINTSAKSEPQVLAEISDSAENHLQVIGQIQNGIHYTPWLRPLLT